MNRLFSTVLVMTSVVGLTPSALADDDDDRDRHNRRWHREQFEARREWTERQEELAEERREWEEDRREAREEWQEEQREAAERYRERQQELWEDEQEWRRDTGRYYSYRPRYSPHVRIYRGPEYLDGHYYEFDQPRYRGGYDYAPGRSYSRRQSYYGPRHYHHRDHDDDDYNPRGTAVGSRIGARIGAAIAGGEGAAIGGRLGAEIGAEVD